MNTVLMKGITRRFGDVLANDSVEFSAFSGEIHGLVGENGAGKSTLMKILAGMYRADRGEIRVDGKPVVIHSPHTARRFGIAMVYQQFSLVEALTAFDNVILGSEPGGFFLRNLDDAEQRVRLLCRKFRFTFDLLSRVSSLSVGEKQQLEIVKALFRGAQLLILDEPTSLLAPPEVEPLFRIIRTLRAEGKCIIFISHKLDEILELGDRITVMRDGRVVATGEKSAFSRDRLAELIVGTVPKRVERLGRRKAAVRGTRDKLKLERICLEHRGREALRDVSFSLRHGEILGVAGVIGNGQTELADVLGGSVVPTSGKIVIDGTVFTGLTPALARRMGIAHIPENTREYALIGEMTVSENTFLGQYKAPGQYHRRLLTPNELNQKTAALIRRYGVNPPNPDLPVRELSGGNQQKVVVARELSWMPSILVASYPTRGLDLATRTLLHDEFLRLRRRGVAILLISADLEEVLTLSDRVIVFYAGEVRGPFEPNQLDQQRLGLLMTGSPREEV